MKRNIVVTAIVATTLILPAFAQDKPFAESPKGEAQNAQTAPKTQPHSHLEERMGIQVSEQPPKKSAPVDKSKHSHPRDR